MESNIEESPSVISMNCSINRRKQRKPNRVEHNVDVQCSSLNEDLIMENIVEERNAEDSMKLNILHLNSKIDQSSFTFLSNKSRSLKRKDQETFCQKEFSNKYFLKTHLSNKHGIVDQNCEDILDKSSSDRYSLFSRLTDEQISSSFRDHPSSNISLTEEINQDENDSNNNSSQRNHTITNERFYQSSVEENLLKLLNPLIEYRNNNIKEEVFSEKRRLSSCRSLSSDKKCQLLNSMHQCHLCRKRFQSNKYLELHRKSKHQFNEINCKEEILNDELTIECNLCSKKFFSQFLLEIHRTNVHGIEQSKRTKSSHRLKSTRQVQLRVHCQICKKELCNKYFLRAHIKNLHSQIDNEQIQSIEEQSLNNKERNLIENQNHLLSMQAFIVESDDQIYKDSFLPSIIYLPSRYHLTKPLQISFKLKPIQIKS